MNEVAPEFESELLAAGVIRYEPFITAGGQPAEVKVELDCLDPNSEAFNKDLFCKAVGAMALRADGLRPDYVVSAPHGADGLTKAISAQLGVPYIIPEKNDLTKEIKEPEHSHLFQGLLKNRKGIIVDDVLTAGSTMKRIHRLPLFYGRIIAGLVVWDRFPHISRDLPFATHALIERHIPLKRREM